MSLPLSASSNQSVHRLLFLLSICSNSLTLNFSISHSPLEGRPMASRNSRDWLPKGEVSINKIARLNFTTSNLSQRWLLKALKISSCFLLPFDYEFIESSTSESKIGGGSWRFPSDLPTLLAIGRIGWSWWVLVGRSSKCSMDQNPNPKEGRSNFTLTSSPNVTSWRGTI